LVSPPEPNGFREAIQLEKFKGARTVEQMVAIHEPGENREILAVGRSADEMDQTGRSAEREFAILGLNRRSELLRNIQAALRCIEDRTFGTCCDEMIVRNRLVVVP
jgi:RNA polymerase-binding transcription factor DksA